MKRPLLIAHRGAPGKRENTVEGFLAGIRSGAEWIELDVHQTADGRLVAHHDFHLGGRWLAECTLPQVKRLGRRVKQIELPTLDEVIEAVPRSIGLGIEIKAPFIGPAVVKKLTEHKATDRALCSSFHFPTLQAMAGLKPRVPTGILTMSRLLRPVTEMRRARARALCQEHSLCDRALVREVRRAGCPVFVWTVNKEADLERMIDFKVDGIITDYPERLRRVLDGHGAKNYD